MTDNYTAMREAIEQEFIETIKPLVTATYGLQCVDVKNIKYATQLILISEAKIKYYSVVSNELIFTDRDAAIEQVFHQIDLQRSQS